MYVCTWTLCVRVCMCFVFKVRLLILLKPLTPLTTTLSFTSTLSSSTKDRLDWCGGGNMIQIISIVVFVQMEWFSHSFAQLIRNTLENALIFNDALTFNSFVQHFVCVRVCIFCVGFYSTNTINYSVIINVYFSLAIRMMLICIILQLNRRTQRDKTVSLIWNCKVDGRQKSKCVYSVHWNENIIQIKLWASPTRKNEEIPSKKKYLNSERKLFFSKTKKKSIEKHFRQIQKKNFI